MQDYSALISAIISTLSDHGINPVESDVDSAVSWAENNIGNPIPPYYRASHHDDPKSTKDAYFRVSFFRKKGGGTLCASLHLGTNSTSRQPDLGGNSKGKTIVIDTSSCSLVGELKKNKVISTSTPLSVAPVDDTTAYQEFHRTLTMLTGINEHPYLQLKRIEPPRTYEHPLYGVISITKDRTQLAIPIKGAEGNNVAYCRIFNSTDAKGKYKKGFVGKSTGGYTPIGFLFGKTTHIELCEGFASAYSNYMLTSECTFAVYSASNADKALVNILDGSYHKNIMHVTLAFDGDEAGDSATASCIAVLEPRGIPYKIRSYGRGKDPSDGYLESISSTLEDPLKVQENIEENIDATSVQDSTAFCFAPPDSFVFESSERQEAGDIDETHLPLMLKDHLRVACSSITKDQRNAAIMSVLSGFAAISAPRYFFADPDGKRTYGNIWLMVLGRSGRGKSHVLGCGTALIKHCSAKIESSWQSAKEGFDEFMVEFTKKKARVDDGVATSYEVADLKEARRHKKILEARLEFLDSGKLMATSVNPQSLDLYLSLSGGIALFSQECFSLIKELDRRLGSDSKIYLIDKKEASVNSKILCSRTGKSSGFSSLSLIFASTFTKMGDCSSKGDIDSGFFPRVSFCYMGGHRSDRVRRIDLSLPCKSKEACIKTALRDRCESLSLSGFGLKTGSNHGDDFQFSYDGGYQAILPPNVSDILNRYGDEEVIPLLRKTYGAHEWGDAFEVRIMERLYQYAMIFESMVSTSILNQIHVTKESALAAIAISRYEVKCSILCLKNLMSGVLKKSYSTDSEIEDSVMKYISDQEAKTGIPWVSRRKITSGCSAIRRGKKGAVEMLDFLTGEGYVVARKGNRGALEYRIPANKEKEEEDSDGR